MSQHYGVSHEDNRNAIPLALFRTVYLADSILLDVLT